MTNEINKALDSFIDELFSTEEVTPVTPDVEKGMIQDDKPQEETADEAMKKVPSSENDKTRGGGRPKEISDVPKTDTDGSREGNYDSSVTSKNEDGKTPEQSQVKPSAEMVKKAWEESPEFKEYVALKKVDAARKEAEVLQKAKQEQEILIKSVVREATAPITKENEELRKTIREQGDLIKAIANKPQRSKAITSMVAVEKFQKSEGGEESFSKADLLDAAEELQKSGKLTTEHVIELEQTGFIYEKEARETLERFVKRTSR